MGLAGTQAAVWVWDETLSIEHAAKTLTWGRSAPTTASVFASDALNAEPQAARGGACTAGGRCWPGDTGPRHIHSWARGSTHSVRRPRVGNSWFAPQAGSAARVSDRSIGRQGGRTQTDLVRRTAGIPLRLLVRKDG